MPAVPNGPPSLPRARLGGLGPSARGWGTRFQRPLSLPSCRLFCGTAVGKRIRAERAGLRKKTSSEKLEPALALPTGVCSTATLSCAPIFDSRCSGTGRSACAAGCAPICDSRCSGTGRSACAAGCAPIFDSKRRAQAGVPVCATFYTKLRPKSMRLTHARWAATFRID